MSKLITRLKQLTRTEPQQMGFKTKQSDTPKVKIQLIASLPQDKAAKLVDYVTGADAGLIRISKAGYVTETLQSISQAAPDIPWGAWLSASNESEIKQSMEAGCDFIVFPAAGTPFVPFKDSEVGKILEIGSSVGDSLLRTANILPVDAVILSVKQVEEDVLTWEHLMDFQRFAGILNKPLMVPVPTKLTDDEILAIWEAGVNGLVIDLSTVDSQDTLKVLRQQIDELTFHLPRKSEKVEPLLPHTS
jgi:hypothetical protein